MVIEGCLLCALGMLNSIRCSNKLAKKKPFAVGICRCDRIEGAVLVRFA